MKPKNPATIETIVAAKAEAHGHLRQPIAVRPDGALMKVINLAMRSDVVQIGVATYLEAGGFEGNWMVRVTGVELVPIENQTAP